MRLEFCMEKPQKMTRFGMWGRTDGGGREGKVKAEPKPNPGRPWGEVLNAQILCRQLRAFICSSGRGDRASSGNQASGCDLRAMPRGSGTL